MKYVDLNIGQPFKEATIGMIGRITQVHDSYLIADMRDKMSLEVIFRRQITIEDLSQGGFSAYHCPIVAEFELPGGVILAVPSNILRARSHLLGIHGLYRLGRFPLLKLDQEPTVDLGSVVPLSGLPASTAEIAIVQQALSVELSETKRRAAVALDPQTARMSLEVTDPARCE